jgi:1-acyl-sn-glycerol-3-phosphate acyltransferase
VVQLLISVWIWAVTAVLTILWFPLLTLIYLFTAPFDPGRYTVGRWFRRCAVVAVKLNPLWTFRTSGYRPPDPRRPYVAVSNHESMADIFLISHLPWEMKWLSKESIFRIPVMGWMMRMAGDIPVVRSARSSRVEALEQCADRLKRKVSVMIFPEGTRSKGGELLPFKDGAFRLAIENGLPILPMAVAGTRNAIRKGSMVFGRARAEVRVLEPIPTDGLTLRDIGELRDRVRALIQQERDRLLAELAAAEGKGAASSAASRAADTV